MKLAKRVQDLPPYLFVGISINLSELKSIGYKPFVVGFIAAITVGIVVIISMETFLKVLL